MVEEGGRIEEAESEEKSEREKGRRMNSGWGNVPSGEDWERRLGWKGRRKRWRLLEYG
jgi:hypothetical protein